MRYKYILCAAIIVTPWVFSFPPEDDWARGIKEKALISFFALLPAYFIWFHNKWLASLLVYLNLFTMFRDNDVSFSAFIVVLAYSGFYLMIQRIHDDFLWLKKAIAFSFGLVFFYGVLQLFNFHPILSMVNSTIQWEGQLFAKKFTERLSEKGELKEGRFEIKGKDYLKAIVYKRSGNLMVTNLEWLLPKKGKQLLRVNGMFGNPNDWLGYILVTFPFVFYFIKSKQVPWLLAILIFMVSAVLALKYNPPKEYQNLAAGIGPSISIRLQVYNEIFDQYKERWVLGHGLGTFKIKFPQKQKFKTFGVFTYAHNDGLQFLYETGLVGFILLMGAIINPLKNIRLSEKDTLISCSSLGIFVAYSCVNFPAHIAPTMLTAMVAFSLLSRSLANNCPNKV
jgi:hypothetical protein